MDQVGVEDPAPTDEEEEEEDDGGENAEAGKNLSKFKFHTHIDDNHTFTCTWDLITTVRLKRNSSIQTAVFTADVPQCISAAAPCSAAVQICT